MMKIVSWVLPYTCVFCSQPADRSQDLCTPCLNELPILTQASESQTNPFYDQVYALFDYQPPITQFILKLKFNQALLHARILGELLAERIKLWYEQDTLPSVIIPMPLHPKRLRERGFNQALEIARPVSRLLQLPIDLRSAIRVKHTAAQSTLKAAERAKNITRAFRIDGNFQDKSIAVIDDVITTGHTMLEFCRALKKAGAKRIDVWCCARTVIINS